jgi:ketosteroid isomerase-like protein
LPTGEVVDEEKQIKGSGDLASTPSDDELERNPQVEEFFRRLMEKQDMRRPKPSAEAIAAALQAMNRLGLNSEGQGAEDPPGESRLQFDPEEMPACSQCGFHNQIISQFCGMCGAALNENAEPGQNGAAPRPQPGPARHHYHHHYHHHYFAGQGAEFLAGAMGQRAPSVAGSSPKEPAKARPPLGGPALSRTEAALRKMTQEWALACNNKQLDDLLTFYATDALVLRPNVPPVRGSAAIREFFFSALDAGLGDIEMEPLRVELLSDVAYEAGRCQMLVPVAVGKRREERGKYVVVFAKQKDGEWKAVVDSWSSDLNLNVATPSQTQSASVKLTAPPRAPLSPPKPR